MFQQTANDRLVPGKSPLLACLPSAPIWKPCSIFKGHHLQLLHNVDIRQWANNVSEVVSHLPTEARSIKLELLLSQDKADPQESTVGLELQAGQSRVQTQTHHIQYLDDVEHLSGADESVKPSWSYPSWCYLSQGDRAAALGKPLGQSTTPC